MIEADDAEVLRALAGREFAPPLSVDNVFQTESFISRPVALSFYIDPVTQGLHREGLPCIELEVLALQSPSSTHVRRSSAGVHGGKDTAEVSSAAGSTL